MELNEKLKVLRNKKGISQVALCEIIGISAGLYNKYEKQSVRPPYETLLKLANYYGVTVNYLLENETDNIALSYMPEAIHTFEVVGRVAAGYNGMVEELKTGEKITIPAEMLKGRPATDYFVLQVRGNSMYPKILDGDKVLVLKTDSVDSGTTSVVLCGGDEATLKKVFYSNNANWVDLVPNNPEFEKRRIFLDEMSQVKILGKAVKLIRDI